MRVDGCAWRTGNIMREKVKQKLKPYQNGQRTEHDGASGGRRASFGSSNPGSHAKCKTEEKEQDPGDQIDRRRIEAAQEIIIDDTLSEIAQMQHRERQ